MYISIDILCLLKTKSKISASIVEGKTNTNLELECHGQSKTCLNFNEILLSLEIPVLILSNFDWFQNLYASSGYGGINTTSF